MTRSERARLIGYFQRGGVIREPDRLRRKTEGPGYKKGYEVRLFAADERELAELRQLLRAAGFDRLAATFRKNDRIAQPIYGKAAVAWFRRATARLRK